MTLEVIPAEPLGEGIVERLEDALERAKRGEISSLAIAWVDREGSSYARWSKAPNRILLLGALDRLRHKMHQAIDDVG